MMRLAKILAVTAALLLFVIACNNQPSTTNQTANTANAPVTAPTAAQPTPTPADDMTSTLAIYATECARCHGPKGDGGTVTVLKKKLKVPSLKVGHALDHSDADLTKQIRDGDEGEMPAFKDRLKPEEITNLVRLIRQWQREAGAKK